GRFATFERMTRRRFVQTGLAVSLGNRISAALEKDHLESAADALARATQSGQVTAAVLHVAHVKDSFTRAFGKAPNEEAMFLLGSISKPICVTALMTLFDHGEFKLGDRLSKFI